MKQIEKLSLLHDMDTISNLNGTNLFPVNLDISYVVLKHCGDVDFRKLVFTENDEKTCFPASSISDDYQLLPNGCHLWKQEEGVFHEFVTDRHLNGPLSAKIISSTTKRKNKLFFSVMADFLCHAGGMTQTTQPCSDI